jgi:hypothetical protein
MRDQQLAVLDIPYVHKELLLPPSAPAASAVILRLAWDHFLL